MIKPGTSISQVSKTKKLYIFGALGRPKELTKRACDMLIKTRKEIQFQFQNKIYEYLSLNVLFIYHKISLPSNALYYSRIFKWNLYWEATPWYSNIFRSDIFRSTLLKINHIFSEVHFWKYHFWKYFALFQFRNVRFMGLMCTISENNRKTTTKRFRNRYIRTGLRGGIYSGPVKKIPLYPYHVHVVFFVIF